MYSSIQIVNGFSDNKIDKKNKEFKKLLRY